MSKQLFSMSAQFGDRESSQVILPYFREIKKLFKRSGTINFCEEIDEFCFILRVDGEITQWEFEGCENIDDDLKERYISVDIGVPKKRWKSQEGFAIRAYLAECVQDGLQLMVKSLEEKNIQVNPQIFTELIDLLSEEGKK